jgi:hypothetical protein
MKNITKNQTKTRSNVFKLHILDGAIHNNEYVFARTLKSAKNIVARRFAHRNVLSVERILNG